MRSVHVRGGYDVFGLVLGRCLLGLGALLIALVLAERVIPGLSAPVGYAALGAFFVILGLAVMVGVRSSGVLVGREGLAVGRPMRRTVRVPWSEFDTLVALGKPEGYPTLGIRRADGSVLATSLSARDARLRRALRMHLLTQPGAASETGGSEGYETPETTKAPETTETSEPPTPPAVDWEASWLADMREVAPHAGAQRWTLEHAWLMQRWSEPHRSYHTTQHLDETLRVASELSSATTASPADAQVARLALWYHDVAYDPRAEPGSNEHRSATLARDHLHRLGVESQVIDRVEALILATADHTTGSPDPAWPLIHDADLWILASPPSRYAEYSRQVRQEYRHVPEANFASGRAAILSALAGAEHIYLTGPAQEWADVARSNVNTEIQELLGDAG